MHLPGKREFRQIVQRLCFVLLVVFILRTTFLAVNYNYFSDLGAVVIIKALLYSIRIDIATLAWINGLLLIMLALLPVTDTRRHKMIMAFFNIANGLLLFLIVCDNIYFSYTQQRITYAAIYLVSYSFTPWLVLAYCINGWYWVLLLAVSILVYVKVFKKQKPSTIIYRQVGKNSVWVALLTALICLVAIRGFESRSLSPSSILLYFPPKAVFLSSNTGLNLLYSFYKGQKRLPATRYFPDDELEKHCSIFHQVQGEKKKVKPNVVLMVMESFARDYLDSASMFKAYTPFLDSLMGKSLVFTNAFNNGKESTHGLVAVLASLPPFMQFPYYHSPYQATSIRGLGTILNESGYDCSFFLGDVDNSFGFKEFTHSIGIRNYYSRKDFGDDRFYNGAWGIHDENFFLYAAGVLKNKHVPFFATIYNVSSHPPFIIPEHLKKRFTITGQNAAQNSVSYVDYAYQVFFEKIKHEAWFNNTIFIFISDHSFRSSEKIITTAVTVNAIPFFIYGPGEKALQGNRNYVVQQLDIVPTILELTGYSGRFMSFGKSAMKENLPRYAVQKSNDVFQIIDSSYVLGLNSINDAEVYLYDYKADPFLRNNLTGDTRIFGKKNELTTRLNAMRQQYNTAFIRNRLKY